MALLDTLFKKKVGTQRLEYFKMLNGYTPVYTSYNGGMYEMLQTKAIINTIASDCGKAIPQLKKHNKQIEYMLRFRPNPFMNTSDFIERVVTNYLCDNNSFIVPILDKFDRTVGLFPISYSQAVFKTYEGKIFLEFKFNNQVGCIEYERVGHLRRMQYKNDLFGDSNRAILETLEVIHSQNQAVIDALKNSGSIRFMGQISDQLIKQESFEKERKMFTDINFKSNNGQFMIYDSRFKEIKQVESKPVFLDEKQKSLIDENLKDYFGVSNKVIQHSFENDYEWDSYYEGVVEPILIKLALELTKMLYTDSQIMSGNEVFVTTNRLAYMSSANKLAFSSQMFDRGIISGNDVCDVWNLPHYEDGDKHFIRKEYAEIQKLGEEESVQIEPMGDDDNE